MNCNSRFNSVKPMLEQLEERALPSFMYPTNTAVQQLAQPLNLAVTDMQNAAADLKAQYHTIVSFGEETTSSPNFTTDLPIAETAYGKAVADYQRIVSDRQAITLGSSAAVTFINAVALSELQAGDFTDYIVLHFGSLFGIPNPTNPLTNPVNQANNIFNDSTLQSDVNTDFSPVSPLYTHSTIAEEVAL